MQVIPAQMTLFLELLMCSVQVFRLAQRRAPELREPQGKKAHPNPFMEQLLAATKRYRPLDPKRAELHTEQEFVKEVYGARLRAVLQPLNDGVVDPKALNMANGVADFISVLTTGEGRASKSEYVADFFANYHQRLDWPAQTAPQRQKSGQRNISGGQQDSGGQFTGDSRAAQPSRSGGHQRSASSIGQQLVVNRLRPSTAGTGFGDTAINPRTLPHSKSLGSIAQNSPGFGDTAINTQPLPRSGGSLGNIAQTSPGFGDTAINPRPSQGPQSGSGQGSAGFADTFVRRNQAP